MNYDIWILLTLAIVGVIDVNLERYTGRGIIARTQDWLEAKHDADSAG